MQFAHHLTPDEQKKFDARTFRLILQDYLKARELDLLSVAPNWEREVARWLDRVGGMAGQW